MSDCVCPSPSEPVADCPIHEGDWWAQYRVAIGVWPPEPVDLSGWIFDPSALAPEDERGG